MFCCRWTGEMECNTVEEAWSIFNFNRFIANSKRPKTTVCTIDIFFFVIKSKPKVQAEKDFLSDKLHVYKKQPKNCGKL